VSSKYTVDGKSLTFAVNDQLDSGKSATYKVVATPTNVENASGDNYTLRIKKDADIVAEELGQNAAAFRVSVYTTAPTSSAAGSWSEVSLGQTTIKGGNFTLTRDSNFGSSVNASWWYNDVTIAKGTFKANQAVKYEKVVLTWTKFTPATDFREVIRRASLKIGSRTYQAEITSGGNIKIDSEVYLDKGTHDVELIVSLANSSTANASVNEIVISNITADSFVNGNYLNSDETTALNTQIAGSIRVAKINIAEQKMGLKKDGPSDDVKVVMGSTDEKAVLEGTITNTADKDLTISSFTLTGTYVWALTTSNYADAYVVLGEKNSSRVSFAATPATENVKSVDLSTTIEAGKSMKFTVYVMPSASLTGNESIRFDVAVKGKADGNDVTSSSLKSAYIKVKSSADATAIASSAKSKIIFPGVSTPVAEFEYTVKNDSAEIETAVITGLNGSKISDLTIDFWGKVGAPALSYSTAADTVVTFNNRLSIPEGTYNVKVYATFDDVAVSGTGFEVSGLTFKDGSTERGSVTFKNNTHYVAKAYPVLSRESYSSDKDAPSLEIGVSKTVKNGESATVAITALSGYYMSGNTKQDWASSGYTAFFFAGSDNLDMDNLSTSKEILKSSTAKIHVTSVTFTVKASDDTTATTYTGVAVNSIADFAKLTNE